MKRIIFFISLLIILFFGYNWRSFKDQPPLSEAVFQNSSRYFGKKVVLTVLIFSLLLIFFFWLIFFRLSDNDQKTKTLPNQENLLNQEEQLPFQSGSKTEKQVFLYNDQLIDFQERQSRTITLDENEKKVVLALKNKESITVTQTKQFSRENNHVSCHQETIFNVRDQNKLTNEEKEELKDYFLAERRFLCDYLTLYLEIKLFLIDWANYNAHRFVTFFLSFFKSEALRQRKKDILAQSLSFSKSVDDVDQKTKRLGQKFKVAFHDNQVFFQEFNGKLLFLSNNVEGNNYDSDYNQKKQNYNQVMMTFFDLFFQLYSLRQNDRQILINKLMTKKICSLLSGETVVFSFSQEEEFLTKASNNEVTFFDNAKKELLKINNLVLN